MSIQLSIIEGLRNDTILSLIPGLFDVAVEKGSIKIFEQGSVVIAQGDQIFSLYIPISGHLILKQKNLETGEDKSLGYLQKKRALHVREILENKNAPFSALADSTTTVLALPVKYFLECISSNEYIGNYLKLMVNSPGVRSLKFVLDEHEVDQNSIIRIVGSFQEDTIILKRGESVDLSKPYLYAIDSGQILVKQVVEEDSLLNAELNSGTWFGGEALVPPNDYTYSAEASLETVLRRLNLTKVATDIDDASMTDHIVSEPWITLLKSEMRSGSGIVTPLPGEKVGADSIRSYFPQFDFSRLIGSNSDSDSWFSSAVNFASLNGWQVSRSNIRNELKISGKNTFLTIADALEPYGLMVTPLKFSFENIQEAGLPGLVTYGKRLVILFKVAKNAVLLADPCIGFVYVKKEDFLKYWNGVVVNIETAETDKVRAEKKNNEESEKNLTEKEKQNAVMWRVAKSIYKLYWRYPSLNINLLLFTLAGLILGLLGPKIAQFMLDEVLALRNLNTLAVLMIGSGLLLFTNCFKSLCVTFLTVSSSIRFDVSLSSQFYRHALSSPSISRGSNNVSEFTARYGAMNSFKGFITSVPDQIIFSIIQIAVYSAMLITYDATMALIAFSLVPLVFLIRWGFKRALRDNYEKSFQIGKKGTGMMMEILGSIAAVKSSGVETKIRHSWEENAVDGVLLRRNSSHLTKGMSIVVDLVTTAVQMSCLWLGCQMAMSGEISLGEVMAVNMYVGSLIGPLTGLTQIASSYEQALVDGRRMADFFSVERDEETRLSNQAHSLSFKGKIKLERINFRYKDDEKWVLNNIDLTIFPRQVVALVGRSGCGKTTLANIIAGNLKPTTGRIYFDDFNSDLVTLSSKRKQVGFIMQDSSLLSGSILDNIAYADDEPDYNKVDRAGVNSASAEFIRKMPQKYMTHLAEGGMGLSGGQKQRVTIARSLYKEPQILLMDEATSALDSESESEIVTQMRSFLRNKTAIIIAHRYSTIRNADRIIVMKDGEIVGDGTHDELVRLKGHYCELFVNQVAV